MAFNCFTASKKLLFGKLSNGIFPFGRQFTGLALLLLSVLFPSAVLAQSDETVPSRTLKAGVSKSLYLPENMYGYWSVTGTLIESNAPTSFNRVMHNIWVLEQVGDAVVISNPLSGASASVNVEKVDGQTATFHHTVVSKNGRVFFEMPTVTVDEDILTGVTVNEFRYLNNGKVSQSYYAKYRLDARRIGGEKVRFQQERPKPSIEIDDQALPKGN